MSKPDDNVYRACPCGSGQKYKFCCLEKDRAERRKLEASGGFDAPDLLIDAAEEAHRKGAALISQMRGREAIPFLERAIQLLPSVPSAHNNLALAHFMEGDIEKALEVCERVDRVIDPGNVFALGQRVHYLLLQGRRQEAEETGRRILTLPGRDESAVFKKCEALARLRLHREVHDTAVRGMPLAQEYRESLAFFAGTAAANLASYEEAERLLSEAVLDPAHGRQARAHRDRLRRRRGPGTLSGEWPYLLWGHWTMPRFLDRLQAHPDEMKRYPGFIETITSILDDQLEDGAILNVLGMLGTSEAIDLLKRIALGTFGTERIRLEAMRILLDCGTFQADVPVRVWIEGQWRMVRPQRQELSTESASPLPDELREDMCSMVQAMKTFRWARAVALGRAIVAKAPDAPQALFNLAVALLQQGKKKEPEALLRRAIASDPSYLFAPASLAMMKANEGKVSEARAILEGVEQTGRMNPDGCLQYTLAQAHIAALEGKHEDAARCWRIAQELDPNHPSVKESRRSPILRLAEFSAGFAKRRRVRQERQRRRLLSATAGLQECLGDLTVEQFRAMARTLGMDRLSGLKKEELKARLFEFLRDAGAVRSHLGHLPREPVAALRGVWSAGGKMPYEEFTKTFGSEEEEVEDDKGERKETPLTQLMESGLVVVGTIGTQACVLIPAELRKPMAEEFG